MRVIVFLSCFGVCEGQVSEVYTTKFDDFPSHFVSEVVIVRFLQFGLCVFKEDWTFFSEMTGQNR